MKPKNLIILVVVAAVLAGLAVLTNRDKATSTPDVLGNSILPDLPVNDVARIAVRTRAMTATVERVEGTWIATSKYNYPADFSKVRGALMKLSELKIGQVARLNDEQCDALKLHPPADDNGGTQVSLYDASGKELASLLLGETHERKQQGGAGPMGPMGGMGSFPDGRFVSLDDGKTVYLVDETLNDVSSTTKDWLDTDLVNVSGSDVMEVSITASGRAPVTLKRPEKGKTMELTGLAENEELQTSKMYSIESAISYLRLADLAGPALSDEQLGLDKPVVFQATTVKDEVYTLSIGGKPDSSSDRYIRIACAMKPAQPEKAVDTEGMSEEEKKAAEDKAKEEAVKRAGERKETEDKIKALSEKLANWTFVIESYKADSMLTKREDLVEEKKEEEKDEDSDGADKPAPPPAPKPVPTKPEEVKKPEPVEKAPAPPAKPAAAKMPEPAEKTAPAPAKPVEVKKPEPPKKTTPVPPAKPAAAKEKQPAVEAPAPMPAKPASKPAPEAAKPAAAKPAAPTAGAAKTE
jgi:hypothetical protein